MDIKVCQKEKSVNGIRIGLLEPLTLPEHKWADMSMGFIMELLSLMKDMVGMLAVVDRAMKLVHLLPMKQTISVSENVHVYRTNIGKLHGIPRTIVSDRNPQFVSRFWQELWWLLRTKLRIFNTYHRQIDGQTEAMNRVVEMVLRCILHESLSYNHWEKEWSLINL